MGSRRTVMIIGVESDLQLQIEDLLSPLNLKIISGSTDALPSAEQGISLQPNDVIRSKLEKFDLTTQQIRILEILLRGAPNKEIANAINLSEQGIKYHVSRFLRRFHARNRRELRLKLYGILEEMN